MAKNLPAHVRDVRDAGSVPGLGRFPLEEEMSAYSSIFACTIP